MRGTARLKLYVYANSGRLFLVDVDVDVPRLTCEGTEKLIHQWA